MTLPAANHDIPLIAWGSEIVRELEEEQMWDEIIELAEQEFFSFMKDLRRMKDANPETWRAWPPWKVVSSVRGLCQSLGFERLNCYSRAVKQLRENIRREDLEPIIETMEAMFAITVRRAKAGSFTTRVAARNLEEHRRPEGRTSA
eukprot:CAMPEP_0197422446 /NCGR_PEP_ID=MMETSP1170-20131217/15874_1 /TAXON_ID=54406 /ORGANISM="Sarcinochrysis sp, Strain CCMP770" /LENGTH=145 /DNA_ID=CAMNT_0042949781 /DNA_START=167 /DNA_END=604 /DNA_ORIENTATION=+